MAIYKPIKMLIRLMPVKFGEGRKEELGIFEMNIFKKKHLEL